MGLTQQLLAGGLILFLALALIRVFAAPLRLVLRLAINTTLGFLALGLVDLTAGFTGVALGLNPWNAAVIGVLGLPGFVLLLLLHWVL